MDYCGLPGGSDGKESVCNAGDPPGLIPGSVRSLGNEMATHSSILAWKNPWTEEPGGLESMGSQRVRQDVAIKHTQTNTQPNMEQFGCSLVL